MYVRQNLRHGRASIGQLVVHELLRLQVRNQIGSTNREARKQIELRNHRLNVVNQLTAALGAEIIVDDVNEVATRRLLHDARHKLPVLDCHAAFQRQHRKGSGDQLGTRPGLVLTSKRTLQTSEDIHGNYLWNHDARLADAKHTGHGVLKQLNNRAVRARTDDIAEQRRKVSQLSGGCDGLRHVHIHLVTVKVCIVRPSRRHVQTERGIRKYAHAVSHHGCLVKRRLTIEEHCIPVDQVAVDDVSLAQINRVGTDKAQIDYARILLEEHRLGTGMLVGSVANVCRQTITVEDIHNLWERQVHSNLLRHAQLIQINVRIRRND